MATSVQKVNTLVETEFDVFDIFNVPVLGLVNGDFTKFLSLNGVNNVIVVTVTEVANGRYNATFTPNAVGYWCLTIRNPTYNERGWTEGFDVTVSGPDLGVFVVDTYTYTQIMSLIGAALGGKISGAPLLPVFRSMDDTVNRITSICDANGNRTVVTLNPTP
jgi:hypothetical protein